MKRPDPKWNWLFLLWSHTQKIPKKDEASQHETELLIPALALLLRNPKKKKTFPDQKTKTELVIPALVPILRNFK